MLSKRAYTILSLGLGATLLGVSTVNAVNAFRTDNAALTAEHVATETSWPSAPSEDIGAAVETVFPATAVLPGPDDPAAGNSTDADGTETGLTPGAADTPVTQDPNQQDPDSANSDRARPNQGSPPGGAAPGNRNKPATKPFGRPLPAPGPKTAAPKKISANNNTVTPPKAPQPKPKPRTETIARPTAKPTTKAKPPARKPNPHATNTTRTPHKPQPKTTTTRPPQHIVARPAPAPTRDPIDDIFAADPTFDAPPPQVTNQPAPAPQVTVVRPPRTGIARWFYVPWSW